MGQLTSNDVGGLLVVLALVIAFVWLGLQTAQGRRGYGFLPWLPAAVWTILAGVGVAGLGAGAGSADVGAFLLGIGGSMVGAGIVHLIRGRE